MTLSGGTTATHAYGEASYWDQRYRQDQGPFDWYQKYAALRPLLDLYLDRSHRVLLVGCGNSVLGEEMIDDGYKDVVNIDISSVVIEAMQKKYLDRPEMKYIKMDVRDMSAFESNSCNGVIDKGTLDSLMCGHNAQQHATKMLEEVDRILKDKGVYILITYGDPKYRLYLLKALSWWHVNLHIIAIGQTERVASSPGEGSRTDRGPVRVAHAENTERNKISAPVTDRESVQDNNAEVGRIFPIVSEDCEIRGGVATPISSLRKLGAGDVDNTVPIVDPVRAILADPGRVPEAFPVLGIVWPEGLDSTDDPESMEVALPLIASTEKLLETVQLPSVEKMKSWLVVRTRGYQMFGGTRDLWMAKLAFIWEEFGRRHAVQRQREQIQVMLDEETENHRGLLAAKAEARAQSRLLQEEADAARRQAEELAQDAVQSALRISELEKRKT